MNISLKMRKVIAALSFIFTFHIAYSQETTHNFDIVVVGGTPGGIMSAIASARLDKKVAILERTKHIGGLPANGLGATDIGTRGATTGLFLEFIENIKSYYIEKYGENSAQVKDCSGGYHFEPSIAETIFEQMITDEANITVFKQRQFESKTEYVTVENGNITSIQVFNRKTKNIEVFQAKVFIDATYEGDLAAAAGVPFRLGREAKEEFNEIGAGKVYKYWGGPEGEGSTFEADEAIQAYNYRLCLTNDPNNWVKIEKPEEYNRDEFVSLIEDVKTGRHTGVEMMKVSEDQGKDEIKGTPQGIWRLVNMVSLPNQKTDANNQHLALISTDLPEENWKYPTADWEWRDKYATRLKNYTLGLLWFAQNDPELPHEFREACSQWGLAKDEYLDNNNFPRQIYVREGRRIQGYYLFTANDALPVEEGKRPPTHKNSITASHYALDSHAVRKREENRVHLDGFISYPTKPYTVPYFTIIPRKIDNLAIPVPVSGTHIGFSTLRMEPCWMALGQAAGIAASFAIDQSNPLKKVAIEKLQEELVNQGSTLIYFEDLSPNDDCFEAAQYFGLRGIISDWKFEPNKPIDKKTANLWFYLANEEVKYKDGKTTRKEVIMNLYQKIQSVK